MTSSDIRLYYVYPFMENITVTPVADFHFENHGSVIICTPLNLDAQTFVDNEVSVEDWQWFGNGFACDHRMAMELAEVLVDHGFRIS